MNATHENPTIRRTAAGNHEVQLASFYLGELLLGIDIQKVSEINRVHQMTPVPHADNSICGVINLRGEVVTIIDLRTVLGMPRVEATSNTRFLIVNVHGEKIGLLVDRITDVVTARADEIDPRPENLGGVDGRFFEGVYKPESGLLVILDVMETLSAVIDEAGALSS